MSLFGSIGIGPVRVGASTSGRSSGGIGGGAGFLVILAVVLAFTYWQVTLIIVAVAMIGAAIVWMCRIIDEDNDKKAEIIDRAHKQHAALMDGDDHYGIYGNYPPEVY